MTISNTKKDILVFAISDHAEAMRVAAGLTIFGHRVSCIFVDRHIEENAETIENAELLELCEIEPLSILDDANMQQIDQVQFRAELDKSNHILTI
ncbi:MULTISPECIES: hypothetical protein [Candidatus Thioglobus]|jgi:hypothetical protein|uniref:Sulfur reduction protein DsrE n=1 Tax=Candidatus Thioglobus autotrophicus TaxID=1705394 RepID=A0A0M4NK05_9GAMM|nr:MULTISPECIES: hypothetical protein [Candidatus Thioglobus]ALE53088.1 hypothetical protein SP60_07740 [Candidatus Thioglobus autotrophicus]MBT3276515.1 hypothetical protein [Candidatus Thioglobus sp.]MBT7295004.1 hypothetical protein [Candidatus Thioglobus sp.]WPE17212.1 hypothetical protein R5P06_03875 [Candidatus Thioglobus autotrophicus]